MVTFTKEHQPIQELIEQINNGKHCLTVKQLKGYLEKLPENMPILVERINDAHFGNLGGWQTYDVLWDDFNGAYPEMFTEGIPAFGVYTWDGVCLIHCNY